MLDLHNASVWILAINWVLFSGLLAWNHIRVRTERRRRGIPEEKPAIRDSRSMSGLALEGLSFAIAFAFYRSASMAAEWRCIGSIAAGGCSVITLFAALRHLDLEWRIKAVVTEDHRLITTGPYALIRHPVFCSLFCLLLAQVLLLTEPLAAVSALAICFFGTEIRIRAEDGLLRRRFGARFEDYSNRVPAWVPFLKF